MGRNVAVIGGGAAGMIAAVQAAKAGAQVTLYEKNDRVGKKLLATGNGKCNFSNMDMNKNAYYGSAVAFYDELFSVFGVPETMDFFGQCGMLIRNKNGYLYPFSEQAATVLDVLRFTMESCHVKVYTNSNVSALAIMRSGSGLQVTVAGEKCDTYDAVILACGSMASPKTGSDGSGYKLAKSLGHHVTELAPALVQLRCREDFFKSVAGVRTQAGLTLWIDGEAKRHVQGELQLTDYGISGIPVFQFSREAAYALMHGKRTTVGIDLMPQWEDGAYRAFWEERWKRQAGQTIEQFLTGISNKKINQLMIKLTGAKPFWMADELPKEKREKMAALYRNLMVTVKETNGFEQAQVCAGGIPADELTQNLESQYVPGLYFAGEIIDIDGICGGYNLQWAWTSGFVAGQAAAKDRTYSK